MIKRPNQKHATTSAGTRVDTKAEADVELLTPTAPITSDAVEDGLPRAEPMLGSLL